MTATKRILDFTNVKEQTFNPKRKPAGDYRAIITKVEDHFKEKDGQQEPQWVFSVQLENDRSAIYPIYCQLAENTLWKIRNLFVAAGKTVPKKRVNVDPNAIEGKVIGISLEDDSYQDREKSSISATFPADDIEKVEVKATPRKTTASKKAAPVVEGDDIDIDDEDIDDL